MESSSVNETFSLPPINEIVVPFENKKAIITVDQNRFKQNVVDGFTNYSGYEKNRSKYYFSLTLGKVNPLGGQRGNTESFMRKAGHEIGARLLSKRLVASEKDGKIVIDPELVINYFKGNKHLLDDESRIAYITQTLDRVVRHESEHARQSYNGSLTQKDKDRTVATNLVGLATQMGTFIGGIKGVGAYIEYARGNVDQGFTNATQGLAIVLGSVGLFCITEKLGYKNHWIEKNARAQEDWQKFKTTTPFNVRLE